MVTFQEDFLYPLYLLLIGSGVLGVAVALLTYFLEGRRSKQQNDLEDRRQKQQNDLEDLRKKREIEVEQNRKELEIKVDLVSDMAEAIGHQVANALTSIARKKKKYDKPEEDARYEDQKNWFTQTNTIRLKLESYFPGIGIAEIWRYYTSTLFSFSAISRYYFLEDPCVDYKSLLKSNLQEIREYFSDNRKIDWDRFTTELTFDMDLWIEVYLVFMERGDFIMKEVLKRPIEVF